MSNFGYGPQRKPVSAGTVVLAIIGFLLLAVAVSALTALVAGLILMLLLGALHNSVSEQVPALGYWVSVLIAFVIRFVGGLIFGSHTTSTNTSS